MIPALRRRLVGNELPLLFAILCGLALVIPGLVIPTFTRVFIDNYLLAGQTWLVKPLLWAMGATLIVHGLLTFLQRHVLLRLETKLSLVTSSKFFNHILRLPAAYFSQRFSGEIGSRVLINDKVAMMVSRRFVATVIDSIMTVFYAALMFTYDVVLTLIVIGISFLNVAAVRLSARVRVDNTRRLMQDRGKLMGTAMNGLQMMETLKATGSEPEFFARWSGYYAKVVNTDQLLQVIGQVQMAVPAFVQTLSTATVLVLGGLKVMSGEMTVGMLVAYQTLLSSFARPLTTFVQFGAELQELQADMNRLDDVTRYPADPQYEQTRESLKFEGKQIKLSGHVELRNITFGYSPLEKPLIEDFNLIVQPGRRVALVGGSGSGKSTVAKVVSGLYKQWSGDVLFDGIPREKLPRDLIANSLAVVDQEVFLFGGSVADNVTMWDTTIAHAARQHGRARRRHRRRRRGARRRLPVENPGRRRQLQRRPVSAPRDRAVARRRARDHDPGRGDERARPAHRAAHRREPEAARLHVSHHRAPAQHDPRRRRNHRHGTREDRAARHAR